MGHTHFQPTSPRELARTGLRFRTREPKVYGDPWHTSHPVPAVASCKIVVMTHPARAALAAALVEQFQAYAPVLQCDDGAPATQGVLQNGARVLERMAAIPAGGDSHWSIVIEDDAHCPGLELVLPDLLKSLPAGCAAWSLHSDLPNPRGPGHNFQGWRHRVRGEILRTQFAGFRRELVPWLQLSLTARARSGKRYGWDTAIRDVLDAKGLRSAIYFPNPVQHRLVPSLLGHHTKESPTFRAAGGVR